MGDLLVHAILHYGGKFLKVGGQLTRYMTGKKGQTCHYKGMIANGIPLQELECIGSSFTLCEIESIWYKTTNSNRYVKCVGDDVFAGSGLQNGEVVDIYFEPVIECVGDASKGKDLNEEGYASKVSCDASNGEEDSEDGGHVEESEEDDELSDVAEETVAVRQTLRSQRRSRRRDTAEEDIIELGPARIDVGFEDFHKRRDYAGKLGGDENYISSSDVDSFASDFSESENYEEGDLERKPKDKFVHYDPNCKIPIWELDMVFKSVYEFRFAVVKYSVYMNIEVEFIKNDIDKVRVKCGKYRDGCPWLLYASLDGTTKNFMIKTYIPEHKCNKHNENKWCNSRFVAYHFKDRIISAPSIKVWQFQDLCKKELKLYVGRYICSQAKKNVLREHMGDWKSEFARIFDYKDELLRTNPGSTCVIKVDTSSEPGKKLFEAFYVCFKAVKDGFKEGCRRLIGFDGCFLKGACEGQLLVAVAKDGNHQMFPLAWAIVEQETKATWSWFINLLKKDLELGDGTLLTVVTDMQKGLVPAIQELLPEVEHRMSARHILANWAKKWRGNERRIAFWKCARSTFEAQLKENLRELAKLGSTIVEDLLTYNKESWCRVYFNTHSKCDVIDNNMSETFNGWILATRFKSIITMLEEIRVKVMNRVAQMREFARTWICDISPMVMKILEKNKETAMGCHIEWNGDDGFEVTEGKYRHVVNLQRRLCSCRYWALKGIPCAHAICAMNHRKLAPEDYVAHWYRKEAFLQAYSHFIQPLTNMSMWPESTNPSIEPPVIKAKPGRPKKNRRKDKDEVKKVGKSSRKRRHMHCSLCKQSSHNKRGCPTLSAPQATINASESNNKRARMSAGIGVYYNLQTGFIAEYNGSPAQGRVISTGTNTPICSANVTGDIGFRPPGLKWKGKAVITTRQLAQQVSNRRRINRSQQRHSTGLSSSSLDSGTPNLSQASSVPHPLNY